jgi:hypothetical protein
MSELLHTINTLRRVPSRGLGAAVRSVVVILSAPCSGAELLHRLLAAHPSVASMDGDTTALLALTGNGFGFNSDSDALAAVANGGQLADLILDDMTLPAVGAMPVSALSRRWRNSLLLHFPARFAQAEVCTRLERTLDAAFRRADLDRAGEAALAVRVLREAYADESWRLACYDGMPSPRDGTFFDEAERLARPPFALPRLRRRLLSVADVADATLLFAAPSDAYRIGLYENLFPHARIRYLHLCRAWPGSVNALMDGWLAPYRHFSHDMLRAGAPLAIGGYSDATAFGRRWWKFDLPPDWRATGPVRLEEVCLQQWLSAQQAIVGAGVATLHLSYEDLLAAPDAVTRQVTDALGLAALSPLSTSLPAPGALAPERVALLRGLGSRSDVAAMMATLGYPPPPG